LKRELSPKDGRYVNDSSVQLFYATLGGSSLNTMDVVLQWMDNDGRYEAGCRWWLVVVVGGCWWLLVVVGGCCRRLTLSLSLSLSPFPSRVQFPVGVAAGVGGSFGGIHGGGRDVGGVE